MGDRCYVYAIAAPDVRLPEGVSGFGGPLRILAFGELSAVISQTSVTAVDHDVAPVVSAENLMHHERVVEAVCSAGLALPVRFGTVLSDPEAVTQALTAQYATLLADLHRLGDKREVTVTALWQPGADARPACGGGPSGDPQERDPSPTDCRPGLAYLRGRQATYRQAEAARERAQILARDLDEVLHPLALDLRRNLCPSERLALRDVYLVAREWTPAFEQAFEEVRRRHQEVRFLLSGPWPPYSFVTSSANQAILVSEGEQFSSA